MNSIKDKITLLAKSIQLISMTYDKCAKSNNLTYTELQILNLLSEISECTQKEICDKTFLPKQTVSNVLVKFEKLNIIMIDHSKRKNKTVKLTDDGRKYCEPILKNVRDAETYSMSQFSEEDMTLLTFLLNKYASEFHKGTNKQLQERQNDY